MATSNRKPYLTATSLTQALLDEMQDNLEFRVEMVVDVRTPPESFDAVSSGPVSNDIFIELDDHQFEEDDPVTFTGSPPGPLVVGTTYYVKDPSDNSFKLTPDPVTNATIIKTTTGGVFQVVGRGRIRASDRNKYVGSKFYEALCNAPGVSRTMGEWLAGEIEFSSQSIDLANVDGRYNAYLPGGAKFGGWIGNLVRQRIGIADVANTYSTIFDGEVTDIAGFQRRVDSIGLTARDRFNKLDVSFPPTVLTQTGFPDIEDDKIGLGVPVIYGDHTVELREFGNPPAQVASIPGIPVNGKNAGVIAGTTHLQCIIAEHDLTYFDTANVFLFRNNEFYVFNSADIIAGSGNRSFQVKQDGSGGVTLIAAAPFRYESGDEFFVRVRGKDLGSGGAYDDNVVWICRDLLLTYTSATDSELHSNWASFRDRTSINPANSISTIPFRLWRQEGESVIKEVLGLLEEIRLELFIDRSQKIKLSGLHLEHDINAAPTFSLKNWDVKLGSFNPKADDRNQWNRATAEFDFDPSINQQRRSTGIFKNQAAIDQSGKAISKTILFPHLYQKTDVENQLMEMIKLASAYPEFITVTVTPRALLLDLGDFIFINVSIGSSVYENVPAQIRQIDYDPSGEITLLLWSFGMTPFTGYTPGFAGTVGGITATIVEE